jgi:uncharacterized phage protein gp47/JayE
MPTYPLATLAPTVSSSGISTPQYADIYQSLLASFQQIYGADIYVTPDSQDGQLLAIIAQAIYDSNQATVTMFQSFAPSFAQGATLSSLVKINGLARLVATNSTAVGNVVGTVGTIITNGAVRDVAGNLWNLPTSVTIPIGGTISVTVTAQVAGTIAAGIGTINQIYNPQLGWQSFSNTTAATPGAAVESDAALRTRQALSTALPALGIKEAIYSAVGAVNGVVRFALYENDTGSTDGNGIPAHSFSIVAQGGTVADITTAIATKKPPGIQTYGSTSNVVYDKFGIPSTINYYVLAQVPIYFVVTIKALTGYVSTTGTEIINAIAAFVNATVIGEDVYLAQCQGAGQLITLPEGQTFYISDFRLGIAPAPTGTSNIVINFNQAATCLAANITLNVT